LSLVVSTNSNAVGAIYNENYSVRSQEVPIVSGIPLVTPLLSYSLSPDQQAAITAGAMITYTHRLTNTSIISQSFHLELASSLGWALLSAPTSVDIDMAPSEVLPIYIQIQAPVDAAPGQTEETSLTVSTLGNPVQQRSVASATKVIARLFLPLINKD
jgi:hypothetical protein